LNVLAGRAKSGRVEGQILVNGHPWSEAKSLRRFSAYIMQDDILLGTLTPKETLSFAAAIKLPKKIGKNERNSKVDDLLDELGLLRCQKTRVGTVGIKRGISGGVSSEIDISNKI
jgi:ATP-binding cassette subfamily G (WHITE) protein 2